MSGVLAPISDILTRLATLQVVNQTGITVPIHARIWNDQFRKIKEGSIEYNPLPASYLEFLPSDTTEIGKGVLSGPVTFRIHLAHENYDNGEGTFQQDLIIFGLRDKIVGLLNHFQPTGCSMLTKVHEEPNYEHDNVYEYLIDFACTLLDDTGSDYRDDAGIYINSTPPLALEVEAEIEKAGDHQLVQQRFRINGTDNRSN